MPGFSSDQFYKFNVYEGAGKSISRKADDNANFNYPSNRTTPLFTSTKDGTYTSNEIQRGFIRGIYPAALGKVATPSAGSVKQRRLFFQFNPTTLDRSVAMSTSVLNPLLQDPSNLLQPVPGSADFSFDILFNRESEVVSNKYSDTDFKMRTAESITSSLEQYGYNTKQSDVSSLGVLADLYVLDSIIGQSITPDMIDFLKDYWNNASTLSQESYTTGDGSASFSFDSAAFDKTVNKNLGNSAFLSPLPIRVVFSSLFMVEGFVTSSSVQFVKFTSNYVPTICKVSLQIRALYIGFAKEKAYLTDALETAVADSVNKAKKDQAASLAAGDALRYGTKFLFNYESIEMYNKTGIPPAREYESTRPLSYSAGSIFDWYNNTTVTESESFYLNLDSLRIKGTLKTFTNNYISAQVKDEGTKWNFSAKLIATEITPDKQERELFNLPVTFKTNNEENDIGTDKIAENALKSNTPDNARVNKWYVQGKKTNNRISDRNSTIRLTMELTRTLEHTLPSGNPETLTYIPTKPQEIVLGVDSAEGRAKALEITSKKLGYSFNEIKDSRAGR